MTSLLFLAAAALLQVEPANPDLVRFAAYGDVRSGQVIHNRIATAIAAEGPDAVFMTGDLVQRNEADDWAAFTAATRELRDGVPYFPAVGNHDVEGIFNASEFDELFSNGRYYEVRLGNVAFFVVDSTQTVSAGSAQGRWLERRLKAAASEGLWMVAVHHHPVFSTGPHGPEATLVRDLQPLYEKYGVHLVLQGHDHLYERARIHGVTYIVTGGGGAPTYTPRGELAPPTVFRQSVHHWIRARATERQLSLEAVDADGNVIDQFDLEPGDRGWPADERRPHWPAPVALAGCVLLAGAVTLALRRVSPS